jgi:hypothetical protein
LRIAATTICLGLRRPRDFNRVTSATIARKTSAGRAYLQIVASRREGEQVRQQVIATLGRFDEPQKSGQLERLLARVHDFSPPQEQNDLESDTDSSTPATYGAALAPQAYRRHRPHQLAT